jgi:hypothetical protein
MTELLQTDLSLSASTSDAETRAHYVNPVFDDEAGDNPAKAAIDAILDQKIKVHRQNNMVIDAICDDLATRAEFFHEDITDAKYQPRLYLFHEGVGRGAGPV